VTESVPTLFELPRPRALIEAMYRAKHRPGHVAFADESRDEQFLADRV
jgi:hypothetical protein